MSDISQQLKQAIALIKAGERKKAIQILLPILQQDNDNADAWWLLANCLSEPGDAREALENVLRLRPDHTRARQMLEKLNELHPPPAPPAPDMEPWGFGSGDSASDPFAGADPTAEDSRQVVDLDAMVADRATDAEQPATGPRDLFGGPAEMFGAPLSPSDPFGGPAETFGPSTGSAEIFGSPTGSAESFGEMTDPFDSDAERSADPFAGDAAPAPRPKRAADDLFGPAASRKRHQKKGGSNPLVIILAVIGALVLIGCIGCLIAMAAGGQILGRVAENVIQEIDPEGIVQTLEAGGSLDFVATLEASGAILPGDTAILPDNIVQRGGIAYGDVRTDTLSTGQMHGWTFEGSGGDQVVIMMNSKTAEGLDSYVLLYGPDSRLVASDDDGGQDYNARLEATLPTSGRYTIVARGFGVSGGNYELRLERR